MFQKIHRGWKVVRRADNRSAAIDDPRASIAYTPGRWVKPRKNCGPLAVFKTRLEAERFWTWRSEVCKVVEVEYVCDHRRRLFRPRRWALKFRAPRARIYSTHFVMTAEGVPTGTAFARKVRVIA